jgi:hypothetical protein
VVSVLRRFYGNVEYGNFLSSLLSESFTHSAAISRNKQKENEEKSHFGLEKVYTKCCKEGF